MGLLIVGNGGHGKVVLECARALGFSQIAFLTNYESADVLGVKCYHENKVNLAQLREQYPNLIVALGDNAIRLKKSMEYQERGFHLQTLIHPTAFVSSTAKIGAGSVVLPFAVVHSCARIGTACIINTGAIVEHDCVLLNGVHLSPNSAMGGGVCVGEKSLVCVGASIKNAITIGNNCIVGAGAVVIRDVQNGKVVVGVPANRSIGPLTEE